MLSLSEINLIAEKVAQLAKPADEIMSIEQAAEYLHTTRDALAKRIERKQIPFHKKNGRLYFSRNELNAYYLTDSDAGAVGITTRTKRRIKSFAK